MNRLQLTGETPAQHLRNALQLLQLSEWPTLPALERRATVEAILARLDAISRAEILQLPYACRVEVVAAILVTPELFHESRPGLVPISEWVSFLGCRLAAAIQLAEAPYPEGGSVAAGFQAPQLRVLGK